MHPSTASGTFRLVLLADLSSSSGLTGSAAWLLTVHLLATAGMVGIIWFVQVVHYPLFSSVGRDAFVAYELRNTRLTSFVVGPFMAAEGVTAVVLAIHPPATVSHVATIVGLALLGLVLACTVLVQVPDHSALSTAYTDERAARLVRWNWVRTAGWTARGALAGWMVVDAVTR